MTTAVVACVAILWSYVGALTAPGTDSVSERSAEWLRSNHLDVLVNLAERVNYALHPPRAGGVPKVAINPTPAAPPGAPGGGPSRLASPASPPLPGEGTWTAVGPPVGSSAAVYATLVRPDAIHTSYLDGVVWFDPHRLTFRQFPGSSLPGGPWDRPASVPSNERDALIAAFEGGFRPKDSHGGIVIGGRTLVPLRVGGATLAIKTDGTLQVGRLGRDVNAGDAYDSLRQNLDLIVDAGSPVAHLAVDPNQAWGFTGPADRRYVWRSGVGVTPSGAVIWVGGPALSVGDLADTFVRAGAVRAMELDINPDWVQLNLYARAADGSVHGRVLLADMSHTGDRYLTTDSRDFVAVLARTEPAR